MKKRLLLASICAFALVAVFAFAGCGSGANADDKKIIVGASPSPHAQILNDVVKDKLKEKGYELEVVEFDDYVLPNTALANGEIDANYFQHLPYLENFNDENETDLVSVETVHFEPLAIYKGKTETLESLKKKIEAGENVSISVPNDTTNEARALLLLAENGIVTLPENADLNVTAVDIVNKPKNLTINEVEAAQVARSISDADVAVVNGNYANEANLNIDEALALEAADSLAAETYANILAVNEIDQDSEKTKALAEALRSDEVRDYIISTYGNAVVPVF